MASFIHSTMAPPQAFTEVSSSRVESVRGAQTVARATRRISHGGVAATDGPRDQQWSGEMRCEEILTSNLTNKPQ